MQEPSEASELAAPRMSRRRRVLFALVAVIAGLVLTEVAFRIAKPWLGVDLHRLRRFRAFVWTGRPTLYEPHPYLLFVERRTRPFVNSRGFVDREHPVEREPGVTRIACLGASTTAGGEGSYPRLLERMLEERTGRRFDVMNFGVPGWTTAETMMNYFMNVQDFAPDVVILHHAVNDLAPRVWPGFRSDYSHYRRPWKEPRFGRLYRLLVGLSDLFAFAALHRRGSWDINDFVTRPLPGDSTAPLKPETAVGFRRNIQTICDFTRLRGGTPVLTTIPYHPDRVGGFHDHRAALEDHNGILRALARDHGYEMVDLDAEARARPDEVLPTFLDVVHVRWEGNEFKARLIADALLERGLAGR
jgi:hypothetical protein